VAFEQAEATTVPVWRIDVTVAVMVEVEVMPEPDVEVPALVIPLLEPGDRFPLTNTTRTAAYAAVAAKTSCLRALVNRARVPANATVRPLRMHSFFVGLETQ
jgi:hypothetical protein